MPEKYYITKKEFDGVEPAWEDSKDEAGARCRKPSWWQPYSNAANLIEQAERIVESRKEEVFLRYLDNKGKEDGVLSYQGLWSRAGALAAAIRGWGLKPGDRVLLCFAFGVEFIVVFWACLRAGVIAVPVYPPNPSKMAQALAKLELVRAAAGATVCLMDTAVSRMRWLSMLTQSWPSMSYYNTDSITVQQNAPPFVNVDIKLEDIAFLQFTSGSTGDPKGVIISHRNLWHNLNEMILPNHVRKMEAMCNMMGYDSQPMVTVTWLPQYHDMGLVYNLLSIFAMGSSVVVMSPLTFVGNPVLWLQAMSKYRATCTIAPNFAYGLVVKRLASLHPDKKMQLQLDLSRLLFVGNAAERVSKDTIDAWQEAVRQYGFRGVVTPGYGLAEHVVCVGECFDAQGVIHLAAAPRQHLVSSLRLDDLLVDLRIVDTVTRREVSDGVAGEIWLRSDSVACGYWGRQELSEEVFMATLAGGNNKEKFLRTGDEGFVENGHMFICGRIKDLIIIGGRNYYPDDCELAVTSQLPTVVRPNCIAAFSIEDDDTESLAIVFEVYDGKEAEVPANVQHISRIVSAEVGISPSRIVAIKARSIPKTTSGKIQRHATKRALIEGSLKVFYDTASAAVERQESRICIIGAGLAGLSLAHFLQKRGYKQIHVYDRDAGVGGKAMGVWCERRKQFVGSGQYTFNTDYDEVPRLAAEVGVELLRVTQSSEKQGITMMFFDPDTLQYSTMDSYLAPVEEILQSAKIGLEVVARDVKAMPVVGLGGLPPSFHMPVQDYLKANAVPSGASAMISNRLNQYSPAGYLTTFSTVPAAYWLKLAAFNSKGWQFVAPDGFRLLCEALANTVKAEKKTSVFTSTDVERISRGPSGVTITAGGRRKVYDALVITGHLGDIVPLMDDASEEEKWLANQQVTVDYVVTLALVEGVPPTTYIPKNWMPDRTGHVFLVSSTHYDDAEGESLLYSIFQYGTDYESGKRLSDGELDAILEEDIAKMGGKVLSQEGRRRWDYFPHARGISLQQGFFERLGRLQGVRNTFYAGSTLNFELTETTVRFSKELAVLGFMDGGKGAVDGIFAAQTMGENWESSALSYTLYPDQMQNTSTGLARRPLMPRSASADAIDQLPKVPSPSRRCFVSEDVSPPSSPSRFRRASASALDLVFKVLGGTGLAPRRVDDQSCNSENAADPFTDSKIAARSKLMQNTSTDLARGPLMPRSASADAIDQLPKVPSPSRRFFVSEGISPPSSPSRLRRASASPLDLFSRVLRSMNFAFEGSSAEPAGRALVWLLLAGDYMPIWENKGCSAEPFLLSRSVRTSLLSSSVTTIYTDPLVACTDLALELFKDSVSPADLLSYILWHKVRVQPLCSQGFVIELARARESGETLAIPADMLVLLDEVEERLILHPYAAGNSRSIADFLLFLELVPLAVLLPPQCFTGGEIKGKVVAAHLATTIWMGQMRREKGFDSTKELWRPDYQELAKAVSPVLAHGVIPKASTGQTLRATMNRCPRAGLSAVNETCSEKAIPQHFGSRIRTHAAKVDTYSVSGSQARRNTAYEVLVGHSQHWSQEWKEFMLNFDDYMRLAIERDGPVVKSTDHDGSPCFILTSIEACRLVFDPTAVDKAQYLGPLPMTLLESSLTLNGEVHHARKRWLGSFLKQQILADKGASRARVITLRHIAQWEREQGVQSDWDMVPALKQLVVEVLCDVMLHKDIPQLGLYMEGCLQFYFDPSTAAAAKMHLLRIVDEALDLEDDLEGEPALLDKAALVEQFAATLAFAAYAGLSVALPAVMGELVNRPEVLERVRAEAAAGQQEYLNGVILECLRLHPPVAFITGHLRKNVTVEGVSLPRGSTVKADLYHAMRTADQLYDDPAAFRPERFCGAVTETARFEELLVMFSAGEGEHGRRCPGQQYAMTLLTNMLSTLVTQARFVPTTAAEFDTRSFQLLKAPQTLLVSRFVASSKARAKYRPPSRGLAAAAGVRVSRNGVAAGDGDGDGELESAICQTCAPILGLSVVDLDVPLIELGLNSIQALRLKERLEQQIPDAEIEIADMLDGITLREILERVRNGRGAEQVKKPKDTPVEKDKVAQAAGKPYSGAKERTPGWSWELVDPDKRRGLEHHYVQVGNHTSLHVVVAGGLPKPGGPLPLLLIHGFPECSFSWVAQLHSLGSKRSVMAIDLRGFGETTSSLAEGGPPPGLAEMCADIRGLLDAWAIDQVILFGHDFGAIVAWGFQALHPHRTAGVGSISIADIALDQIGKPDLDDLSISENTSDTSPLEHLRRLREAGKPLGPRGYIVDFADPQTGRLFDARPVHVIQALYQAVPPSNAQVVSTMLGNCALSQQVLPDRRLLPADLEAVLAAGFQVNPLSRNMGVYVTLDETWRTLRAAQALLQDGLRPPCLIVTCGADLVWAPQLCTSIGKRWPDLTRLHDESWTHWSLSEASANVALADTLTAWTTHVDTRCAELAAAVPRDWRWRRRYLVTGATGFVGSHVVHDLLATDPDIVVGCVVRAHSPGQALQRLKSSFQEFNLEIVQGLDRLVPLCGDVTQDKMGLEKGVFWCWAETCECVLHSAASINLAVSSRSVNADSAYRVIDFLHSGRRKGIIFVSSVATVLKYQGGPEVPESLDICRSAAADGYGQDKYDAERIFANRAVQMQIPFIIVRALQLVGAKSCQRFALPEFFVQGSLLSGVMPRFMRYFPLTPIEVLAKVLVTCACTSIPHLLADPPCQCESPHVLHVVDSTLPTWAEQEAAFRAAGLTAESGTIDEFHSRLDALAASNQHEALVTLAAASRFLDFFCAVPAPYLATKRTAAFLERFGQAGLLEDASTPASLLKATVDIASSRLKTLIGEKLFEEAHQSI